VERTSRQRPEILSEYYHDGKTQKQIAHIFGLSRATISNKMKKYGIKTRDTKYKPKEIGTLNPEDLEYLLGLVIGDGYISFYPNSKYIEICVEEPIHKKIIKLAEEIGCSWGYKKTSSTNTVKSIFLYSSTLTKLLKEKIEKIDDFFKDAESGRNFVRGIYECEGWVRYQRKKASSINIGMTDFKILQLTGNVLTKNNFDYVISNKKPSRGHLGKKPMYELRIRGGFLACEKFIETFHPCIKNTLSKNERSDL